MSAISPSSTNSLPNTAAALPSLEPTQEPGDKVCLPKDPCLSIFFSDVQLHPKASSLSPGTCFPIWKTSILSSTVGYLQEYLPKEVATLCSYYLMALLPYQTTCEAKWPFANILLIAGAVPRGLALEGQDPRIADIFVVFLSKQTQWKNIKCDFRWKPDKPEDWILFTQVDTQCKLLSASCLRFPDPSSPKPLSMKFDDKSIQKQTPENSHLVMHVALISTLSSKALSKLMVFHFLQVEDPENPSEADWVKVNHLMQPMTPMKLDITFGGWHSVNTTCFQSTLDPTRGWGSTHEYREEPKPLT
jgi:hypothetical protein